MMQSTEGEGP